MLRQGRSCWLAKRVLSFLVAFISVISSSAPTGRRMRLPSDAALRLSSPPLIRRCHLSIQFWFSPQKMVSPICKYWTATEGKAGGREMRAAAINRRRFEREATDWLQSLTASVQFNRKRKSAPGHNSQRNKRPSRPYRQHEDNEACVNG